MANAWMQVLRAAAGGAKRGTATNQTGGPFRKALNWAFAPGEQTTRYANQTRRAAAALPGKAQQTAEAANVLNERMNPIFQAMDAAGIDEGVAGRLFSGAAQNPQALNNVTNAGELARNLNLNLGDDVIQGLGGININDASGLQGAMGELARQQRHAGILTDRTLWGGPETAVSWLTEGGLMKSGARIGMSAFALGSAGRIVSGRGGPFTDQYGQRDIAGIPFV